MNEGDNWVLAYANRHGFVGAGQVGPVSTYRLLSPSELSAGWEATHRHLRHVNWLYSVASLSGAIPPSEVDRQAPRNTKELLPTNVGARLVDLLSQRAQPASAAQTITQHASDFASNVEQASGDSSEERLRRLGLAPKLPQRVSVLAYEFVRNADVVAETLYRANGICGRCDSDAPFKRRTNQSPYLEVHHKKRLADGGEDTLDNAIALCPNCHRELHFGTGAG